MMGDFIVQRYQRELDPVGYRRGAQNTGYAHLVEDAEKAGRIIAKALVDGLSPFSAEIIIRKTS